MDADGNSYVTGLTNSVDFPTAAALQGTNLGGFDAFVTKLSPDGSSLVFSTYFGGTANENVDPFGNIFGGLAVDSARNVYVTGYTDSRDFPLVAPISVQNAGNGDAFVAKLNPGGNGLIYSTYLGGEGFDAGKGIAVDPNGNAYVTGETNSTRFPVQNAYQARFGGGLRDVFLTRLNATGSGIVYSTYLGGTDDDRGNGIALDQLGNVYLTGMTLSSDFPQAPNTVRAANGTTKAFVTEFSSDAASLIYSHPLGGSGENIGTGIAVDDRGAAYVTGYTTSTDFPVTKGAFSTTYGGGNSDGFVAKVAPAGGSLVYATYLGGDGDDIVSRIAISVPGNNSFLAYVTGVTTSLNFPTVNAIRSSLVGNQDAFITKLNVNGTGLEYSTYYGGSQNDMGTGIAVDALGNAYVAGKTDSNDFPVIKAVQSKYGGGTSDGFMVKLKQPARRADQPHGDGPGRRLDPP